MSKLFFLSPLCLIAMQFTARADTVRLGSEIQVRPFQEIRVNQWDRGRIYTGEVARDVEARDGDVAIPRGSRVEMIVRQRPGGSMAIDVESITINGHRYVLDASGPQFNTREYQDGGGLLGAIVGSIPGVRTEGNTIEVPSDSVLTFRTRAPLHVVDWQDPGYDRDGNHYHRDPDWYR